MNLSLNKMEKPCNTVKPNILNIAIPTYKRPEQLKNCIESILSQVEQNQNVSITVIDDSESDVNAEVIAWAKNLPINFVYLKNLANLGIDANIDKCLDYGQSDYILVLGEDDILLPGAIKYILGEIEKNSFDILYTSYVYIDNSKTRVIRSPVLIKGKINPIDFVEKYIWAIGFIGSIVVRRAYINHKQKRYLGTFFNHVGRVCVNLSEATKINAAEFPLVGNRSDDLSSATWTEKYYDVLFGFESLLTVLVFDSFFGVSFEIAKKNMQLQFKYLQIHRLALMRSYGVYNRRVYDLYLSIKGGFFYNRIYLITSIFPVRLLMPLRGLYFFARAVKRLTYKVSNQYFLIKLGGNSSFLDKSFLRGKS